MPTAVYFAHPGTTTSSQAIEGGITKIKGIHLRIRMVSRQKAAYWLEKGRIPDFLFTLCGVNVCSKSTEIIVRSQTMSMK